MERRKVSAAALPALALDWVDGTDIELLLSRHQSPLGATSALQVSAVLERAVARDLPWVLSACIEILGLALGDDWSPYPDLAALPAMAKFGVDSLEACYAASIGVRRRRSAETVGDAFADSGGGTIRDFFAWLARLTPHELGTLVPAREAGPLAERIAVLVATRASLSGEG
ncbi:MAG: hypothetical protein ACRDJF_07100 [Actinomycetota bacterium]